MSALNSGISIINCIVGNTKGDSAEETGDAGDSMTNLWVTFGLFGLLFALILLYSKSKTFRFRLKYFCYNFVMMVFAVYAACVGIFHPLDVENFHRCSDNCYRLLTKLFSIRARIDGLEVFHSMKDKNFIIVANHQSSLDMFPIFEATPSRTTFLAKKELLFAPLFGFAAWLFGVVFINRGHSKSARNVMEKTAKWIVEKKINLWIFPEGTRSQTGTLLPFKKGAFHLAQQAQIPIVPIVVYDYSSLFNKKNKIFRSGTIRGKVLPPVSMEGVTAGEVSDIAEHVRQKMLQVFLENKPSENITDELLRQDKKIQ